MFRSVPVLWRLRPSRPVALVLGVMLVVVGLALLSVAQAATPMSTNQRSALPALGLAADCVTV